MIHDLEFFKPTCTYDLAGHLCHGTLRSTGTIMLIIIRELGAYCVQAYRTLLWAYGCSSILYRHSIESTLWDVPKYCDRTVTLALNKWVAIPHLHFDLIYSPYYFLPFYLFATLSTEYQHGSILNVILFPDIFFLLLLLKVKIFT